MELNLREIVKNYRTERGWSQIELAKNWGIPQSTISGWERFPNVEPTASNLLGLARNLNLSVEELVEQTINRE